MLASKALSAPCLVRGEWSVGKGVKVARVWRGERLDEDCHRYPRCEKISSDLFVLHGANLKAMFNSGEPGETMD